MIQSPSPACAAEAATARRRPDWIIRKSPQRSLRLVIVTILCTGLYNDPSIGDKDTLLQREEGIEIHLPNHFFLQSHLGQTDQ